MDLAEIQEKSFDIIRKLDDNTKVNWDYNKIKRMIIILIENAFKYTKEDGNIQLIFEDLGKNIKVTVKDNGIGISKENMDRIFKIYERVNDDRSIIKEGTGIGLSLVRDFAKLHHGSISVKSEVGVGSEFVVKIANTLADENEIKIHYKMTKEERLQNIAVAFSDL